MEDLAVFTALNHDSGSLGKNFVKLKKDKYVIYRCDDRFSRPNWKTVSSRTEQ